MIKLHEECYECGVKLNRITVLTPYDEARYFCKVCRHHYCDYHGEYHICVPCAPVPWGMVASA